MDSYEEYKVEAQQRHVNWINLPFQPGDVDMNILFSASLPTYPWVVFFEYFEYFFSIFFSIYQHQINEFYWCHFWNIIFF